MKTVAIAANDYAHWEQWFQNLPERDNLNHRIYTAMAELEAENKSLQPIALIFTDTFPTEEIGYSLKKVRHFFSHTRLIFATETADFHCCREALRAGVTDCFLLPDEQELLTAAVRQVTAGETFRAELRQCLRDGDGEQVHTAIDRAFQQAIQESVGVDHLYAFFRNLFCQIEEYIKEQNCQEVELPTGIELNIATGENNVKAVLRQYHQMVDRLFSINGIPSSEPASMARSIEEIQEYVKKHFSEDIGLSTFSSMYFLSKKYLGSQYKHETGMSLTAHINACRIEAAKELLKNTALQVCEIAEMCGFNDYFYFAKLFHKQNGKTPTEYRQQTTE